MATKYEIYHEVDWDEKKQAPVYEKLTTLKNEQSAIDFVNNLDNIRIHGDMFIQYKTDGNIWRYNEQTKSWEK